MNHYKIGQCWISEESLSFYKREGKTQAGYYVYCSCGAEIPVGEFKGPGDFPLPPRLNELWSVMGTRDLTEEENRERINLYGPWKIARDKVWEDYWASIQTAMREAIEKHAEALKGVAQ